MTSSDSLATVRAHWDTDHEDIDEPYDDLLDRAEAFEEANAELAREEPPKATADFVHLHVHSEYSLLDGLSPLHQMVHEARRQGMPAIALTDHGNLYGAVDFYSAAKAAGIKPIVGVEAYVAPRSRTDREGGRGERSYYHLVLLAQNRDGYQNLLRLVTRANLEGYYYKPRIDRELLAEHASGLIALSACYSGEPSRAILDGNPAAAREAAGWYREVFKENYFLEIQDHGNEDDKRVNSGLIEIHREQGIPLIATNDIHYALPTQAASQDILLCVQTNSVLSDPKRMRMQPEAFYLKSADEMRQLFAETPDALANTLSVAERCDLKLEFGRLNFPALDHLIPNGEDPLHFLARTCRDGLVTRYGSGLTDEHRQRLDYELDVIQTTGFASYILFVWDFVRWAREHGVPCGPRGSAAGSIILYCLGISDVDPVKYGLTFERFLNPERIQMPDIDMDFADDRRDDVIQYVVDRYGRDRVAQIITFGRLLARAAIRDVGRAMDYPLGEVDRVAKLVPSIPVGLKIDQAIEQSPELKQLYTSDPRVAHLVDTARSVEGVARHAGTHAAGVVVADQDLVNYVPLQKASRGESVMTQYPQKILEKIGLLKMDFLGLANLTMLAKALENIRQVRGAPLDIDGVPLDDPKTYAMLSRGETRTVFQLEGSGMTRYIQELKPSTVEHLAAMVALYRPGPMAHIPTYIARREGRELPSPPDGSLEEVLRETYGIIVYQDQVLQVVQRVAGYSLGQADVLRRAMGKKDKSIMEEEGPRFIEGAVGRGYARDSAEHLWELLQPFAGYAFNKAHAYCYAFLAYRTAYLKANYPAEWFAAVLSTVAQDSDKVANVVGECRRLGIEVLPPDVNRSGIDFQVQQTPSLSSAIDMRLGIRFGLCGIKNVGTGAVEMLVRERDEHGAFASLDDLCRRVDLHTANKRVVESLVKCGALDELGQRESLVKAVDSAIAAGQRDQRAASAGQVSLFEAFGGPAAPPNGTNGHTPSVPSFSSAAPIDPRERAAWEKEVLGFTFAAHPFKHAAPWLANSVSHACGQITAELASERVKLAGVVTGLRKLITKTKGQMAVLTFEDMTGVVEVIVFPRAFEKAPDLWREDVVLQIEGKVDVRDDRAQVILDRAEEWTAPTDGSVPPPAAEVLPAPPPPSAGTSQATPGGQPPQVSSPAASDGATSLLRVVVPRQQDDAASVHLLEQLHGLVERYPGPHRLQLVLFDRAGGAVEIADATAAIAVSPEVRAQVAALVGAENVQPLAANAA